MKLETSTPQDSRAAPVCSARYGTQLVLVRAAAAYLVMAAAHAAAFPIPSFMGLGDLPGGSVGSIAYDVSADGQVVIGMSETGVSLQKSFRWTRDGGMVDLGGTQDSEPWGVSSDGSVIVGEVWRQNGGYDPYRWTQSTGMQLIPGTPTFPGQGEAKAISGDGTVVAGLVINGGTAKIDSFRWTQGSGVELLDSPNDVYYGSQAHGMSGNGEVIIGAGDTIDGVEAFRWTSESGLVSIGDLPGGFVTSNSLDASWDGSVIVGYSYSASGPEAFRWTQGGGMLGLGDLPGGNSSSNALSVSEDGSIVVGVGHTAGGYKPFIWDEINGMRNLEDLLRNELHLDLTGWRLSTAYGVSGDGTVIVGSAVNPLGRPEGWVAVIPEPTTFTLLILIVTILCCRISCRRSAGARPKVE